MRKITHEKHNHSGKKRDRDLLETLVQSVRPATKEL
jgi:hypothetical protein